MTIDLAGLNDDFRDILVLFADASVEYLVVGAYALSFHGAPRATGDLDILVRPTPENAARVYGQLTRFGAPVRAAGLSIDDLARADTVYQIGLPPRRIDILTSITGLSFDEALAGSGRAALDGRAIPFIGRDALLKNKLATGRPRDLADAERLRRS